MGQKETENLNRTIYAAKSDGYLMYRNNTGLFLTLDGQRQVYAGLGKGTHDWIGMKSVIVTPDMVGKKIAVFASIEGKSGQRDMTKEQKIFKDVVISRGGIAFKATGPQDIPRTWIFPDGK